MPSPPLNPACPDWPAEIGDSRRRRQSIATSPRATGLALPVPARFSPYLRADRSISAFSAMSLASDSRARASTPRLPQYRRRQCDPFRRYARATGTRPPGRRGTLDRQKKGHNRISRFGKSFPAATRRASLHAGAPQHPPLPHRDAPAATFPGTCSAPGTRHHPGALPAILVQAISRRR